MLRALLADRFGVCRQPRLGYVVPAVFAHVIAKLRGAGAIENPDPDEA